MTEDLSAERNRLSLSQCPWLPVEENSNRSVFIFGGYSILLSSSSLPQESRGFKVALGAT